MRVRITTKSEIFLYCKSACEVQLELHRAVKLATTQDQVDYLDASHIARIKELRKESNAKK